MGANIMAKRTKADQRCGPFWQLQHLLEKKNLPLKSPQPETAAPRGEPAVDPEADRRLFREAMDGVVPLRRDGRTRPTHKPKTLQPLPLRMADTETVEQLHRLVATGEGFHVADTPEYREGVGRNVPPGITRHLHKGQFSIQDHIDLHGLSAAETKEVLQTFFRETVAAGKRTVLIVHGRGLSSPDRPVLKATVHQWLETGPWRHWVMAYASARACDGGAGATYVLLRERPLKRRFRKKKHRGRP
jgi:DNA-nicking Smr family endonuclease